MRLLLWAGLMIFSLSNASHSATPEVVNRNELWWSQPIRRPAPPKINSRSREWVRNPIDVFVAGWLELQKLVPSAEADKTILIRRLSFDLRGVPPLPEEIDEFVSDNSPRAYEKWVDRYLASPQYGERWARHWLDVARYTESQGFEYDRFRPNAWHYRDYLIERFNQDQPYDEFVREQIAGDVENPDDPKKLVATSLLVCGPWDQAGNSQANATQKAITREEELEEVIAVVGQTFLGLTVNCARCHDHKYDPIPQTDYYRIKAVFEGVRHGERPLVSRSEAAAYEKRVGPLKAKLSELEKKVATLKKSENSNQDSVREEIEASNRQIQEVRAELTAAAPLPSSYVGIRTEPVPTRRLRRGDVTSPEEVTAAGGLSALRDLPADFGLAPDAPEGERRRRFAEWITHPQNPLLARVMANRVWNYHFGQGLVSSPNDFGNGGAGVTHPELLDWLAKELIESGWSVKHLHRTICLSATYRQSSDFREDAAAIDSENRWLWRFSPRRLEAEAIRDAMLVASGEINWTMGGPSFKPFDVIEFNGSTYVPMDKLGAEFNRRTVYRANVNSGKEPMLDVLDCPDPSVKTPRRNSTVTPLQALSLMNSSFVNRQADALAHRALRETGGQIRSTIQRVYQYTLGRSPSEPEFGRAVQTVDERGLRHVCWALFNSTEFLYVR